MNFHSTTNPRVALAFVFILASALGIAAKEASPTSDDVAFFVDQIEPLLKAHCYGCHSHAAGEMEGGLTLDSRSGWANGGERGPAIVPNKPQESLIVKAILREDDDLRMPPDEKLSAKAVELIVQWVSRGAPDPRVTDPSGTGSITGDPNDWWSLRPLVRPLVPESDNGSLQVRLMRLCSRSWTRIV